MKRYALLLSLFREHLPAYLLGSVLLVATVWMTLSIPRLLQQAIDVLDEVDSLWEPAFFTPLRWILIFAVLVIFVRTASRMLFFVPGRRVEYDLKNRLFAHLTSLQRGFFMEHRPGEIISRINNDVNGVRLMLGFGIMSLANTLTTLSLAPVYMYSISPSLTLACALPILLALGLLQWAVRRMRDHQFQHMRALQQLSDFTLESYHGLEVLKANRIFPWAEEKFGEFNADLFDAGVRMSRVRAFFMPILLHISNALKVLLVLYGGILLVQGELSIGGFMAYLLYLTMLVPPLMGMTFMFFVWQRGLTGLISLEEIFNMRAEVPPAQPAAAAHMGAHLQQGLSVKRLSYAYPDAPTHRMLEDISLDIGVDEIVGLFGVIGSGKTTLVQLINAYLQVPPGTVLLDGEDVLDLGHAQLRRYVSTVSQEPFLFSTSIRENIALGNVPQFANAQAETDERLIVRTAADAALESDLERFPAGLDTLAGEKGIALSGGQKQRVALARALLRNSDLLLLDDIFAQVDHDTERRLVERIYSLRRGRATLIVSHRISALEQAKRIYVLEAGRITAVGSHGQLCVREGPYRTAWLLQNETLEPQAAQNAQAQNISTADPAHTLPVTEV